MTQPTTFGGRPLMPAPGVATPELRVAQFRGHARRLTWSAIALIAIAGASGWLYDNLPSHIENWMLLAAAGVAAFVLVLVPFLVWASHVYTITTHRVIERSGFLGSRRRELAHARGYTIQLKRGILQRMWGAGTLTLSNGVEPPLRLSNIPSAVLVHEALVDQVEVSQILAHRNAQPLPPAPPTSPTA